MARRNPTWTRITWHPAHGTEITVTGHNHWRAGLPLVTVTGKVLGTGHCSEGSQCEDVSTPALCQLVEGDPLYGHRTDYVDALIKDSDGKLWRVNACMGEIEVTEKVVHTLS